MMFLGLRKLGNLCMFLNKTRNFFCVPDTKFVYATNVPRAGKRGNICVGNNVTSATMCPRLPRAYCWVQHVACVWAHCCDVLRHVGCCWLKFENGQIFHATFVDVTWCCSRLARFVQQCCAQACVLVRFSTRNMSQHVATGWPNACNMLRPTMLRSVAFKCCDRLARRSLQMLDQHCWDLLRWNVAIVWPGLNSTMDLDKHSLVNKIQLLFQHGHSGPQRPRSFRSTPRIATRPWPGPIEVRDSRTSRHSAHAPRIKSDKSDWFWSQSIVFTNPFKPGMSLDLARGRDSWCWPKGARPLGTRMQHG